MERWSAPAGFLAVWKSGREFGIGGDGELRDKILHGNSISTRTCAMTRRDLDPDKRRNWHGCSREEPRHKTKELVAPVLK